MPQIILNTDTPYKLSQLAETMLNDDSDIIYVVKKDENGNDVSYAVSRQKFLEGISGGSNGKYIVSGGAVWTGTGLVFDVSDIVFNYFGTEGAASATEITLDNGDSQPRFDVIVVDSDGNIEVVQGTPAASPAIPSIGEDQISIQPVLIAAGATEPTITQEFVYRNDAEWTTSTYGSGTGSIDFQSTNDPYEGTFCIDANVTSGIGNRFVKPSGDIDLSQYTSLTFYIRFDTALPASKSLLSSVWNNGSTVGSTVNFMPYGIDRNDVGNWQQITVPTSAFNAGTIDRIQIRMNGSGGQVEYFLDYIVFSTGSSPSVIQPDIITIQNDGATIGARPKINFIPGANVTLSISDDPGNDRVDVTINASASGGGQVNTVVGTANQIDVNSSNPINPVVSLAASVVNTLNQVSTNASDIAALDSDLTQVENDLTDAEADIADLQADKLDESAFLEQNLNGTAIYDAAVTGTYNLDLATFTAARYILTGNTTFTVSNTPASGESFVRSLTVSSTATETLTFPGTWEVISGTYSADTTLNDIQIEFSNYPTAGLVVKVYINQFP